MCEFISWIEYKGKVYFLTGEEIRKIIKTKLKNVVVKDKEAIDYIKLRYDYMGHEEIRQFYSLASFSKIAGQQDNENENFWNGALPQSIIDAWNEGKFEFLFKEGLINNSGLLHIIEYAPINFKRYALQFIDLSTITPEKFQDRYSDIKNAYNVDVLNKNIKRPMIENIRGDKK